ncbi:MULTISPECIES: oxidoreductase [unclassified Mucilaginibacter]|uniref:oxidoreductase n=1 Tax=unclassified Mucilaginibacter TaxID=2617802 RepID=UPI002AC8BA04|nr:MULTISPECIES: oxidoreductase [unclassified Mucilaginibacter]MEB0260689.1 oxidoreductase [Mucilaginibacter sp. 10I4]MEB0277426.1 oxidoreductase [Mucilaginibacter sp. 10B2]MEB0300949.1 oxidoreductase [Mucilaginibacter sp. 5C4]WPX24944.1 oxidoreductase [Mucilaginibacter sp. 5C4]
MKNDNKKSITWLITGCSTGLGRSIAQEVLKSGYSAVITSRNVKHIQDIADAYPNTALALSLDVSDRGQIDDVIKRAEAKFTSIDVLINNAGYGFRGAVEEASEEEMRKIFDTNFFGTVSMIQAVLPGMRKNRSGTIMNLSSIGGRFGPVGSGYYSATKFAIEGLSDALRKEVDSLGIRIVVVEPGAFRTDFGGRSLNTSKKIIADYEPTVGPRRTEPSNGKQPGEPKKAAQVLIKTFEEANVPFRLLLGTDAIKIIRDELDAQYKELEAWEKVSITTNFED